MKSYRERIILAVSLFTFLLISAHAHAQSPSTGELHLVITTKENQPIENLQKGDLLVLEDGQPHPVTSLERENNTLSYGLLLDCSGSVRRQFDKIIQASQILISNHGPMDEAFIIRFIGSNKIETTIDWTSDKSQLSKAADTLYLDKGSSAVIDAVYLAAQHASERRKVKGEVNRRRVLILITDGDDSDSYYRREDLYKVLAGADVQVFIIGLMKKLDAEANINPRNTRGRAKELLSKIAETSGGRAIFTSSDQELLQAASVLMGSLRSRYVVKYNPTPVSGKGKYHKVRVVATEQKAGLKDLIITPKEFLVAAHK